VTSHAYHHGHYDAREREFRGFARVEQIAGESFESFAAAALEPGDGPPANADAANYVPPTLTVVWHHTGAWNAEGRQLADVLAREFYGGDAAAPALTGHDVGEADAPSEAYRALRGAVLRRETYSLDGTPRQPHPFLVENSAYSVKALQDRGSRRHGVFLRTLRDSLTINYEREPTDPRIGHTLNLEVDAFGNVLSSASIFYPRRVPTEPEQGRTLATLTASSFINTPASLPANTAQHYVGLSAQSRQYEIAHAELLPRAGGLVTPAALRALAADPDDFVPIEARPAATAKILREWARTYYRADAAAASLPAPPSAAGRLPFGAIDPLGLPFETCQAVLSPGLRAELYNGELSDADLQMAGYFLSASVDSALPAAAAAYLWRRSPRQATDAARFHVPARMQDPFGNVTRLDHDAYALAVVRIADPLGNETRAEIDYRTLQPGRVVDPNGTEVRVAFDAFGLVAGTARTGKNGEGDTLGGFVSDLPSTDIAAFFADPMATAASLLGAATTRIVYDLDRPRRGDGPAAAATISRESHKSDEHGVASPVQVSIAFSDGHDRVVQIKSRAAPGTVNGVAAAERWVGSGWTIFNNKGAEVQKFEPFFSASADFEFASARGVTRTNFYDPAGRPAAVLHPDGSYAKVLFGAWEQVAWDANDTVKLDPRTDPDTRSLVQRFFAGNPGFRTWLRRRLPHPASPPSAAQRNARQDAAVKAMAHAGTPARQFLDPVGHSILSIATDGTRQLETRAAVDVAGNPLSVTDPRGVVCFSHRLDMLGRKLRIDSSDAGRRTAFLAADDRPVLGIDAVGQRTRTIYDALRRPSETRAAAARGSAEAVVGRVVYGDTLSPAIAAAGNLRTRVAQTFDGAGMTAHERYDFKGNLVETSRRFLPAYGRAADWSRDTIPAGAPSFRRSVRFDALDRPVEEISPDGSITTRRFDEGGRLSAIDVDHKGGGAQAIIAAIDYNARGQRERIVYGNGSVAARTYEPDTFRIASITLKRGTRALQALAYAYDPVGNVTSCADNAFDTVFNANQRIDPVSSYTFDAFYRLAAASGREHEAVGACPAQPDAASFVALQPQPVNNARALRNYTETYAYDDAGNLLEIVHAAGPLGSFTRRQTVAAASNRLASSDAGCAGEPGFAPPHDANGNIRSLAHLPVLVWDHANRLVQATLRAAPSGGAGDRAYYAYDAAGLRTRKVVERGGAASHSRFYVDTFERFEDYAPGADPAVRETLHVMDGDDRLAMLEAWTEAGRDERRVRLQFANHLGSAQLELDGQGLVIGYEEYRPYGDTAYTAGTAQVEVERRRYRYSGKERDAETGVYYFGARYYASWMGRWLSCDPAGEAGGLNQYGRSRNNPVSFVDRDGYADEPVKPKPQVTQTPLNSFNVGGSGVQAESYKKQFWLKEGQATTPFGEEVEAWRMRTVFKPSAGLWGDYPTAVSKDLVLLGTGEPGKSMSTPAPLAGNHLAAKARGEQLKALFDRAGVKPNRFAMTVVEPETVTRLGKVNPADAVTRSQSFMQSVIGRSTNESVAAIGLEIDPASVRIETGKGASGLPLSVEGGYYRITGQFRAVEPPAIPPGDVKLGKVAMHGGGVLLTLALGGLSDTPAYLTKDGKVDYHLDDWMYGVHGWDATGNELGATFGMCPVPASMSSDAAHENNPAFMVGVGAAVGGIAGEGWGAIPGAIVGYLLYLGAKDEN
jgi:RHS repeat-associated protein